MWVGNILASQDAFSFVYFGVVLDDFNSSSTASSYRLQNPKCGRVALSLALKLLIVIREKVTHWCDNEILWMLNSESVHVPPE